MNFKFRKLLKRNQYDSYLSSALGVPLIDYNAPLNEDDKLVDEDNQKPNEDDKLVDEDNQKPNEDDQLVAEDNQKPNEDDKLVAEDNQKPNEDAKDERLKDIDEAHYVLTLDYTMKVCMYANMCSDAVHL